MIVSDAHRIVFVHIPKNAGTTVRTQLEPIDSYANFFNEEKSFGALPKQWFGHLTLDTVSEHFPDVFEKVRAYDAYAVIRDPFQRFVSATIQRLWEFKGISRFEATHQHVLDEARRIQAWLLAPVEAERPDYAHFLRQVEFTDYRGERIVNRLFALENLALLEAELRDRTQLSLDFSRAKNANLAPSNRWTRVFHKLKPIYGRLTTWRQREAILQRLQRAGLISKGDFYGRISADRELRGFVEDFYGADFDLRREVQSQWRSHTPR
jgi:hypothetical protein